LRRPARPNPNTPLYGNDQVKFGQCALP
jgi:hypothetical protein